jgi:multidrug transporter EmrE-like cation transporter
LFYLILAVVSSTLVSVLMRISGKYCPNNSSLTLLSYLMCCLLGALHSGADRLFPVSAQLPFALALGAITGALYLAGFVLLQWNIARNGVVLASSFIKLGVLVPTVLSMTVFRESPQPLQLLGIGLSVFAIGLMANGRREKSISFGALIALLLAGGTGNAMSKIYEEIGPAALREQFLLYIFLFALLFTVGLCIIKKERITLRSALFGLLIGIPNYYCTRFLLLSLSAIPAAIAYPAYSAGGIMLVSLIGMLGFKETLSRRKLASLLLIILSLILLNIKIPL